MDKLTESQNRVSFLLMEGLDNLEISRKLLCSRQNVEKTYKKVMKKLGVKTREALVVFLLKQDYEERLEKLRIALYGIKVD